MLSDNESYEQTERLCNGYTFAHNCWSVIHVQEYLKSFALPRDPAICLKKYWGEFDLICGFSGNSEVTGDLGKFLLIGLA